MEVVTQTNATMCFILLHGPSRDQQQKRRTRKEEETTHKCLFKFTYVIHAYIVLNFENNPILLYCIKEPTNW